MKKKCERIVIDSSLCEAIDLHNAHVDKVKALGKMLFDMLEEDDPVIGAFCDVFNSMAGEAIYLCCEGNTQEEEIPWRVTEDFYVVRDEKCNYGDEDENEEHHDPKFVKTLKLGENEDVWIDIWDSGDMWESWLYRKDMGVKDYMFGCPKVQHPNNGGEEYYDLLDYIGLVYANVEENLKFYDEEYGD